MTSAQESPDITPEEQRRRGYEKIAECRRCNCAISGGAAPTIIKQFLAYHEGHDE